ncbi:prostaglandin-H2 D-isomerase-like [Anolis carolinensis]|uniref:prostaglandin-H2 D-isomerase-like n=1 Tax=Anolis carolinensis TaxID=28377 RepID=UPI002F2B6EBB
MAAAASLAQIVPVLLGLPFVAFAPDVPVQPNFDVKRFEGDWFAIAVVGKEAPIREISVHKYSVTAKRHTGISIFFSSLEGGDCIRFLDGYHEHGQPGIYANNLGEVADFIVVQTDYDTYAVVLLNTDQLQLFSRKHRGNSEMWKIFDDVAAANGFPVEKIYYPVLEKTCYD